MHKKKSLLAAGLLGLSVLASFTACTTTSSGTSSLAATINPLTVELVAQAAAQTGAIYAINQDTNAIPYFQLGVSVLDTALNNGQLSVTNLQAQLKVVSTSSLRNPEVVQFLPLALEALSAIEGKNMAAGISTNAYVAATVTGIDNGLRLALGQSTIPIPAGLTND